MSHPKPTDKELEILQILWAKGPSTVRQVNDLLNEHQPVGYTTSLKVMQIMHEKGLLSRSKSGKTHIYKAEVSQEAAQKDMLNKMIDRVFEGSAMKLVIQALGSKTPSEQDLKEIRDYLDQLDQRS